MRLIYILAWELIQIEEDLALFQTRLRTSTVVVVFGVVAQGHDEDGMHTVVIKIQEFIHLSSSKPSIGVESMPREAAP